MSLERHQQLVHKVKSILTTANISVDTTTFEQALLDSLIDSVLKYNLSTLPQQDNNEIFRQFVGPKTPQFHKQLFNTLINEAKRQGITDLNQKLGQRLIHMKLSINKEQKNDISLNKMAKLNKKGKLIELSLSNSNWFDTYCRMFNDKSHNKFKFDNIYEIVYKKNMIFKDIIIKLSQLLKNYFDPIYYELYYYSKKRSKWLKILNLEKKINQNSFKKGIFKMKFEILFYPDLYKIVSS